MKTKTSMIKLCKFKLNFERGLDNEQKKEDNAYKQASKQTSKQARHNYALFDVIINSTIKIKGALRPF